VQATAGDGRASLSWGAPATDGGRAVQSYRVTTQPGGATTTVAAPTTATTIAGLTNGVAYTFTVEATNAVGTGASSASDAVVPAGVPGPPSGVRATPRGTSLVVSWAAPADDNGAAVSAYEVRVYRRGTLVTTVRTGAARRATVRGLTPSATYVVRVSASNRAGASVPSAASAPVTLAAPPPPPGYWMLTRDGNVYAFGVPTAGEVRRAAHDAVQIASSGVNGYYVLAGNRAHALGNAPRFDAPALRLARGEHVTSMSLFGPRGAGYWLFTSKGRVVAIGPRATARNAFYGDLRNTRLAASILGSVATPTGRGYYMVASDGGVFAFGDARFHGSMGGRRLDQPIVALVPTADNRGYWLVASDGGVFAFGSAEFKGSMGGVPLARPIVGMVRYGNGYLMVAADGGVFNFSNRPFVGSLAGRAPSSPVVSIAAPS
jgi:hypothetical protein